MKETEIKQIVETQRKYFSTGATLPISGRIDALKRLKAYITSHEAEINDALGKDICVKQAWYSVKSATC